MIRLAGAKPRRTGTAINVLGHFITALTRSARGKLKSRHVEYIHISVFCHMILIVLLAKAMFVVTW